MKPYTTTTDQPHSNTHRQTPLDFTALWMRVVAAVLVIVACIAVVLFAHLPGPLDEAVNTLAGVVAVVAAVYAGVLAVYARLQHYTAYGRQERATKAGDEWIINLKREIPVSDRGTVEMEPTRVKLPVAPREFTRIVREMMRNGTGIDDRPSGVSQPLRTKVLRALEDMDGATNGGRGVGWQLSDDLDALLRDIDQW